MRKPGVPMPKTRSEAEAWEAAVLTELRRNVDHLSGSKYAPLISSVELNGEYPETTLSVTFTLRSSGTERTKDFHLWGPSFAAPAGIESPTSAAVLVHTWIRESS